MKNGHSWRIWIVCLFLLAIYSRVIRIYLRIVSKAFTVPAVVRSTVFFADVIRAWVINPECVQPRIWSKKSNMFIGDIKLDTFIFAMISSFSTKIGHINFAV